MSELKHTPGPWALVRDTRPHMEWNITIVRQDNPNLAVCFMTSDGPNEANARLIAAAPELLQALIDLGDWLAYGINKADGAEPTAEDHAACERVAAQARAAIAKATGAGVAS